MNVRRTAEPASYCVTIASPVLSQSGRPGFCPDVNDEALAVPDAKLLKNVVDVNFNSAQP
jgi:hypothetical protein